MLSTVIIIFLVVAFIAANLPWISERLFGLIEVKSGKKSVWLCLIEWFTLYLLIGMVALGIEKKFTSDIYSQQWEFYASTFCLFLVFALPGFIYRFDLKHLLQRSKKS
jgi:Na+(H+)/acetate symporter ActP